ncbi:MAG: polymer-forming cytoskeletal protein [Gemmatimonadota bacterium]|jgi:cytoskeletal protein CcmA (bactofilin family)|nr:polymer-forming cytoskeletal protein [Gemmatimonadota bacterium]MDP6803067.1 polymer-forming cytoskeletal protein [Gemmatimonadota bacterium]MDP7032026.1 polymer-forming cytoskeletal protein [Gemmatimonadota bacterium]
MIGKKPAPESAPESVKSSSAIGERSFFEGSLDVTGNLRVDGKFKGELRVSEDLVVGKNGLVEADVHAKNALITGTVCGNLNASEKISLRSGSRLEGEMVTARLVIEEGVTFQGRCNTAPDQKAASASPGPRPQTPAEDARAQVEKIAREVAGS